METDVFAYDVHFKRALEVDVPLRSSSTLKHEIDIASVKSATLELLRQVTGECLVESVRFRIVSSRLESTVATAAL